jgi:hypothetical protein
MIVTPFGDLEYRDFGALMSWADAHDDRHRAQRHVLGLKGTPISGFPIVGPIDKEWFGRHIFMHLALIRFVPPQTTVCQLDLERLWEDEGDFYRWHDLHNDIHAWQDQALGLV